MKLHLLPALFSVILLAGSVNAAIFTTAPVTSNSSRFWDSSTTWLDNPASPPSGPDDHVIFEGSDARLYLRIRTSELTLGSITYSSTKYNPNRIVAYNTDVTLNVGALAIASGTLNLAPHAASGETGTLTITVNTLTVENDTQLGIGINSNNSLSGFTVTGTSTINGVVHYNGVNGDTPGGKIDLGFVNLSGIITFGQSQSTADAHRTIRTSGLAGSGYFTLNYLAGEAILASATIEIDTEAGTSSTYNGRFRQSNKTAQPEGALTVIKKGEGTQIFTNNESDYLGGTIIQGGILVVANADTTSSYVLGRGATTVENGGTLAGSGFIRTKQAITINAGGKLFPSAHLEDQAVTLTIKGADITVGNTLLEMKAGSSFGFRITDSGNDKIAFSSYREGSFVLAEEGIAIDITGVREGTFTLFTFNDISTPELEQLASRLRTESGFEGYQATFDYTTKALLINITAIPEPSAFFLGSMILLGFAIRRKQNC